MIKNKILILAIAIFSFGEIASAKTLLSDNGPAELPPASFKGMQYVDSQGCVYIRAGYGSRVTWVPRVNRARKVYCNSRNKPSLNSTQLATISGKPVTRLVKPAAKTAPVKTKVVATTQTKPVLVVQPTQKPKRKTAKLFESTFTKTKPVKKTAPAKVKKTAPVKVKKTTPVKKAEPVKVVHVAPKSQPVQTVAVAKPAKVNRIRRGQQKLYPSDVSRQQAPAIQGGTAYNIANTTYTDSTATIQGGTGYNIAGATPEKPTRAKRSVRSFRLFSRRKNRVAIRTTPQAADITLGHERSATFQQASVTSSSNVFSRGVDDVHNLTAHPTTIDADVTARGDAQMALVWTNTVPRKLVKKRGVKQVARTVNYSASTKSQPNKVHKSTRTSTTTSATAPKAAKPSARFVQIGTFGNPTNASNTISRFKARGHPVSTRTIKKSGKSLRVVFLGPFNSATQLHSAMTTARNAGFSDAFYVR